MSRKYTKKEAIKCITSSCKDYEKHLRDKKMLVIFKEDTLYKYLEILFCAHNFQHLTGVELVNTKGEVVKNRSLDFYRKCMEGKLSEGEVQFKKDGTSHLKLEALPALMKIHSVTKISGNYNGRQPYLFVDKVVGGVNVCMGIVKDAREDVYYPASALKKDIKQVVEKPYQVIAVFTKNIKEPCYTHIRHVAKKVDLFSLSLPDEIKEIISLENYIYRGK